MRKEKALVIDGLDLLDEAAGYFWGNMKASVAKEAAACDILIFNSLVVKDRRGVANCITTNI